MGNSTILKQDILDGKFDKTFSSLYPDLDKAKQRYAEAITEFENFYGENREVRLFSAPGRTEIGGNHTDHQHGCVIAGAVNLDVIAVVSENGTDSIRIKSKGYNLFCLGPEGTGKASLVKRILEEEAKKRPTPKDWAYVYNFEEPHKPHAINFPAGKAGDFAKDVDKLIEDFSATLVSKDNSHK